jgi:hypothetical protein
LPIQNFGLKSKKISPPTASAQKPGGGKVIRDAAGQSQRADVDAADTVIMNALILIGGDLKRISASHGRSARSVKPAIQTQSMRDDPHRRAQIIAGEE